MEASGQPSIAAASRTAAPQKSQASSMRTTVAAPGFDTFPEIAGTKDSLMNQLPPEPPSPYRPQAQKRLPSILPSYFQSRMETTKLRDRKLKQIREAEAFADAEYKKTLIPVKLSLGKNRHTSEVEERERQSVARQQSCAYADSIKEHHFFEAQRQQLLREEDTCRTEIGTLEHLECTRALLAHFEDLARAITASELTETEKQNAEEIVTEEVAKQHAEKDRRAADRRALLEGIAVDTTTRLADERLAKRLEQAFAALLPDHEEGCAAILDEEQEALLKVFEWEREHRPLGAGCRISTPASDPRMRYYKKVKKSSRYKPTYTERMIEKLRKSKNGEGEPNPEDGALMVVFQNQSGEDAEEPFVDPPNSTPEAIFVAEGRELYAIAKSARHEAIRKAMATQDLFEAEEARRSEIQLQESEAYLPILLHGVDGVYTARRAAHEREQREAEQEKAELAQQVARLDAKSRILAEDFANDRDAQKAVGNCSWVEDTSLPPAFPGALRTSAEEGMQDCDDGVPAAENRGSTSMVAHRGDLPSGTMVSTPFYLAEQDVFGDVNALKRLAALTYGLTGRTSSTNGGAEGSVEASAVVEATEAAAFYLEGELWLNDLAMPEATATILASQGSLAPEATELLMELASARANLVNEQIEALLELCAPRAE